MKQAISLFYLIFLVALLQAKEQSVKVTGILICNMTRLGLEVGYVKLMEDDWPDGNDFIADNRTDKNGVFWLSGKTSEITKIEPYILIENKCGVKPGCRRETIYKIPEKYINSEYFYNMGFISLEIFPEKDKTICD